jgi:hypothetical protein
MTFVHGSPGLILVAVQQLPGWNRHAHLTHLRIRVHDVGSCTVLALRQFSLYRPAGTAGRDTVK